MTTGPVDILRELLAIPSVNPDGDPASPYVGEQRIAEHLANLLAMWWRNFTAKKQASHASLWRHISTP
jgi:hypothetical protein